MLVRSLFCLYLCLSTPVALATTVLFESVLGDFEIELFDDQTPRTASQFARWVDAGLFDASVIHQATEGFVIQGGAFRLESLESPDSVLHPISAQTPAFEGVFSNTRGTIAMSTPGDRSNLLGAQWFINLDDNTLALDAEQGGFTVFGQVRSGIAVIDALSTLQTFDFEGFDNLPLLFYGVDDAEAGEPIRQENYALIRTATVIDRSKSLQGELPPRREQLIDSEPPDDSSVSGVGAFDPLGIALLLVLGLIMAPRRVLST